MKGNKKRDKREALVVARLGWLSIGIRLKHQWRIACVFLSILKVFRATYFVQSHFASSKYPCTPLRYFYFLSSDRQSRKDAGGLFVDVGSRRPRTDNRHWSIYYGGSRGLSRFLYSVLSHICELASFCKSVCGMR